MTPLRTVFLGSDAIALPVLEWCLGEGSKTVELVAVFTQPDRPVGRGQHVLPNAIKSWAIQHGLPVLQPSKMTEEFRTQLAERQPDVCLVMAYGHILRDDFIATPRLGTLNLHASILPYYRGASPIQTAIACGETETGVSLMRIVRKLDAGPVAAIGRVSIQKHDTALEIEAKLAAACVPLLAENLPRLAAGNLKFVTQDEAQASYCRRLKKEDGAIDFNGAAKAIATRINGLFPWPGCVVEMNGENVKIGLADTITETNENAVPGTVLGDDAEGLRIATGEGILRFLRLQRPGGRMLPAREFLRGFSVSTGAILKSTVTQPLVSTIPFR